MPRKKRLPVSGKKAETVLLLDDPAVDTPWELRHNGSLAVLIIAISLAIRIYFATTYYLNPDEIFNFLFAHQPTLEDVRLETIDPIHAYPPLFAFLLHGVLLFGDSELVLRLPTLLFGTVFLAIGFLWVRRLFGPIAALLALLLLAFSPGMVSLGYEVRNYGLLLACMLGTLYALERTFTEQSRKWLAVAMLSLYVAILTNYSAAWVCLLLGTYVAISIRMGRLQPPLVRQWVAYQLGALGIYAWLYATHISILQGSATQRALKVLFRDSYYWPETDTLLGFIWRQNVAVFHYLFEVQALSVVALLLFMGGLAWLASGRDKSLPYPRLTCLLLGFLPALGCVLALLGSFPYGSSRHSAIFQPFLAAGVAYVLASFVRDLIRPLSVLVVILVPLWMFVAFSNAWYIPGPGENRTNMQNAIAYIRTLPKRTTIFADHASLIELGYYLGRDVYSPYHGRNSYIVEFRYDGYQVLCPSAPWKLNRNDFGPVFREVIRGFRLTPADVWVFDDDFNINAKLTAGYSGLRTKNQHVFGARLAVFQIEN